VFAGLGVLLSLVAGKYFLKDFVKYLTIMLEDINI